jgi:hypothetical protein
LGRGLGGQDWEVGKCAGNQQIISIYCLLSFTLGAFVIS